MFVVSKERLKGGNVKFSFKSLSVMQFIVAGQNLLFPRSISDLESYCYSAVAAVTMNDERDTAQLKEETLAMVNVKGIANNGCKTGTPGAGAGGQPSRGRGRGGGDRCREVFRETGRPGDTADQQVGRGGAVLEDQCHVQGS